MHNFALIVFGRVNFHIFNDRALKFSGQVDSGMVRVIGYLNFFENFVNGVLNVNNVFLRSKSCLVISKHPVE